MAYSSIAFSEASIKFQQKAGSRASYARMNGHEDDVLSENEIDFIAQRDSFYMASMGENGFPYIQHRGGPPGFLKVLDEKRLGFIDFIGNMQYISIGNLASNNKVALILMDYPAKARLKIYAEAEVVDLNQNPELYAKLNLSDYKFRPERMLVLTVKGFNWNCPQHITQRFTLGEVEEAFESQREYISKLEEEIRLLKLKQ